MKIRYLVEGESEPREVEEPNFDFEEYKDLMMGKITDEHGNALNDVFIGNRSYSLQISLDFIVSKSNIHITVSNSGSAASSSLNATSFR